MQFRLIIFLSQRYMGLHIVWWILTQRYDTDHHGGVIAVVNKYQINMLHLCITIDYKKKKNTTTLVTDVLLDFYGGSITPPCDSQWAEEEISRRTENTEHLRVHTGAEAETSSVICDTVDAVFRSSSRGCYSLDVDDVNLDASWQKSVVCFYPPHTKITRSFIKTRRQQYRRLLKNKTVADQNGSSFVLFFFPPLEL